MTTLPIILQINLHQSQNREKQSGFYALFALNQSL